MFYIVYLLLWYYIICFQLANHNDASNSFRIWSSADTNTDIVHLWLIWYMWVHLLRDFREISFLNSVCLCLCVQLLLFTCCDICLQDLLLHSMHVSISGEREQRCNNWPTKECVQQIVCKGRWPFPSPDHPGCFSSLSLFVSLSLGGEWWLTVIYWVLGGLQPSAFDLMKDYWCWYPPHTSVVRTGYLPEEGMFFIVRRIWWFTASSISSVLSLTHSLTRSDKNSKSHYRHNWFSSAKE